MYPEDMHSWKTALSSWPLCVPQRLDSSLLRWSMSYCPCRLFLWLCRVPLPHLHSKMKKRKCHQTVTSRELSLGWTLRHPRTAPVSLPVNYPQPRYNERVSIRDQLPQSCNHRGWIIVANKRSTQAIICICEGSAGGQTPTDWAIKSALDRPCCLVVLPISCLLRQDDNNADKLSRLGRCFQTDFWG